MKSLTFLVAGGLALGAAVPAQAGSKPNAVVAVEGGSIAGSESDGILSWKGIPFAAPPVGERRWRAPQPVEPWSGVRQATSYGNDCMQKPFESDAAPLGAPPSEDCLYANVWRPAKAKGKLPVMVWIYGGGFVNGGASPPTYSGAPLAAQGIMVVSFNYRVGRFGTFVHPALIKADEDEGLIGNYGFMDQIAALEWVNKNIAAFGGDPSRVTIVGESAGGASVHTMVTSPMARGLFAGAVVMSGADGNTFDAPDLATNLAIGERFAEGKGIMASDPDALARLRALSPDAVVDGLNLMAMFAPEGERTFSSPFVDGRVAVDQTAAYRDGSFAKVPMMIGATSADLGGNEGMMVAGARRISGLIAQNDVPVWEYRFSYVASSQPGEHGAAHASDIPFFFDTQAVRFGKDTTARDNAMGAVMSGYLANFVKTGKPDGNGLKRWPAREGDGRAIMDFTARATAEFGPDPIVRGDGTPVK